MHMLAKNELNVAEVLNRKSEERQTHILHFFELSVDAHARAHAANQNQKNNVYVDELEKCSGRWFICGRWECEW